MEYPAQFKRAPESEGGFVITFRDIPEAITQGDTEAEAMEMAEDVLLSAMEIYIDENRKVPLPSAPKRGERMIALPPSAWAKVLLLNALIDAKLRRVDLAERMQTTRQEINRLVDLHHATKIDRIAEAIAATGKHLELRVA